MVESPLKTKSVKFSIRIIKLYKYLEETKREYIMSKQVLRSGTSIGANIHEAYFGSSKKDFAAKMQIALKEASETEYWLYLLSQTGFLEDNESASVIEDCQELAKMLHATVKTAREKLE